MKFSELLEQMRQGTCLSDNEVSELAVHLKLITPKWFKILRILLSVFLSLVSVFNFLFVDELYGLIFMVFTIIGITILFKPRRNHYLINQYLEAIKTYYINRFNEFESFEKISLDCSLVSSKTGSVHHLCHLFSDGYEFYLFSDFLKETDYFLPKFFRSKDVEMPILKVFDDYFINSKPISFNLTEIVYFKASNQFTKIDYDLSYLDDYIYMKGFKGDEKTSFVLLQLTEQRIIKFAPEAIEFFRKMAPDKEKID